MREINICEEFQPCCTEFDEVRICYRDQAVNHFNFIMPQPPDDPSSVYFMLNVPF